MVSGLLLSHLTTDSHRIHRITQTYKDVTQSYAEIFTEAHSAKSTPNLELHPITND